MLLAERVQAMAMSLAELDRRADAQSLGTVEAEIARLEGEADPRDLAGSETRVKRLAFLKRQRRGLADIVERRKRIAGKLETCVSALANMKLDLHRLTIGSQTYQNITSLANQALSLADSVDHALAAADEVGRLTSERPLPRPTP
jgi:eukaryotic-like serine/threonine-protein kinase